MKKILELKQERANLINEMDGILNKVTLEKRSKTEQETSDWDAKNQRVEAIDQELKVLERQEELNRSIAGNTKPEEEKVAARYNLAKAITETRNGNLTGLEAEMHQEAKRELGGASGVVGNLYIPSMLLRANEGTKTVGATAGHIPTSVGNLDVIAPTPLYRELGVTVYEGLSNGKLELPFSKGHSAGRVAEEGAASQSVPVQSKGTLTASRFHGWQTYTQEYLSETAVLPALLSDMVAAIDRSVGKDLVEKAVAANVLAGFATTDVAVTTNYAGVLALLSNLNAEDFSKEGLVISKELFYVLAGTSKDAGSGNFVVDLKGQHRGLFSGVNAFGTSFLPMHDTNKYDMVYGDWKRAYVGFWGGVQLLVDPYSASNNGYIKITFSRMADTAVNPYAFVAKRNTKLA